MQGRSASQIDHTSNTPLLVTFERLWDTAGALANLDQ
ncbi:hypothetical protein B0I08_10660 [Glaciihabitans tibetensis]|uniref:Uncharacterized protein n=1 Tax=Glaciihabitans tibetensis TaxID=1266600 RepID=A0A2T0VBF0_9MICO|nr:hypothetical protein B0I08_10660 [Glaciihabitans tibetensis]